MLAGNKYKDINLLATKYPCYVTKMKRKKKKKMETKKNIFGQSIWKEIKKHRTNEQTYWEIICVALKKTLSHLCSNSSINWSKFQEKNDRAVTDNKS